MKKLAVGILVILVLLLIPFITKDRSSLIKNFSNHDPKDLGYTELSFTNTTDNTKLGGMLFLPKTTDSVPLAIFIQGSGYSVRNNTWYLTLTKHLLENNIAVLLPDKRGSEKSEGDWKGKTIETLATDTEAAIWHAKSTLHNFNKIGVIGMSQGGWVAPVVASRTPIDFAVDVSGTLANGDFQLQFEETNNISKYTYNFIAKPIAKLSSKSLKEKPHIKVITEFDPLPYWKKVTIPNFIAFGENDTNCPVERSLELIKEHSIKHLNVHVYPNGRHAILNKQETGYNELFLEQLTAFINQ